MPFNYTIYYYLYGMVYVYLKQRHVHQTFYQKTKLWVWCQEESKENL